VTEFGVGLGRV